MMEQGSFGSLRTDSAGLVPCIVQDASTGQVLMIGYMNEEALDRTVEKQLVHFYSRSRQVLWMKGETSGNTLSVVTIDTDCDRDAVLVRATPAGPTCHTGSTSCFDANQPRSLGVVLNELMDTIQSRATADRDTSYTALLMSDGDLAARKVLEEAGELAFASKDAGDAITDQRVVEEAADLLYHTLALLAQQGIAPGRVADELVSRRD